MRKNFLLLMLMALLPLASWAQADLSSAVVTVNPVTYDGMNQTDPTIVVTLGETVLTVGTDYVIEGWYSEAECENPVAVKKDAGKYYVKIKGDGTNYDDETTAVGIFTISKATLSVTGKNVSKTYGEAMPELKDFYNVEGFVVGETEASLAPVVYKTYDINSDIHAGVKSFQLFANSTAEELKNYAIDITNALVTLTINQKDITVTTATTYPVFYTGELVPIATTADLEGNFYTLNTADKAFPDDIVCTVTGAAISAKNVGGWAFKLSANDDYNVTYSAGDAGTLRINPVPLKVTANPVTIIYGQTPTYTYVWDGLVDADKKKDNNNIALDPVEPTATAVTINAPYVLTGATEYAGNVGEYAITPNVTSPNYTITTSNGILTVNAKAAFTVETPAKSAYTGIVKTPAVSVKDGSAAVATDGWTVSYLYSETNNPDDVFNPVAQVKNAGFYKQVVTGAGNYTGTKTSAAFQVEKIDLLVKAKDISTYYRDALLAPADFTIDYTGFVNGETAANLETAPTITNPAAINVGTYNIIPSGGESTNYNLVYVEGKLTINPAALRVVARNRNAALNSDEANKTSWTGKEYFSADGASASNKAETYIYVQKQNGVNASGNPTYTNVYDNATILNLLATTAYTWDNDNNASTPEVANKFITGLTLTREAGTDKGNYRITASGASAANSNYTIASYVQGWFTIDKGNVEFALYNQTKTYGDADPEWKYEIIGASAADEAAIREKVQVTCEEGQDVGTYTITLSMTDADKESFTNYNFAAFPTAKLIITKAKLNITAAAQLLYAGQTAADLDQNAFAGKNMKYEDQLPLEIKFADAVTLDGDKKLTIGDEGTKDFDGGIVIAPKAGFDMTAINKNYDITYNYGKLTVINPNAVLYFDDQNTAFAEAIEAVDGQNRVVKFSSRTLSAGQWNTLVLPFATTVPELSAALGYAVVDRLATSDKADVISFKLAFGTIPANEPFLVQPANNVDLKNVDFGTKTIVYSAEPKVDDGQGHEFIGTYTTGKSVTSADKSEYYYSPSQKKFVNASGSTAIGIMRAYLKDNGASAARVINIEEPNGTVTSIETINEAIDKAGETFNLNGMKMNGTPAKKGVYIRNGKKIVVK